MTGRAAGIAMVQLHERIGRQAQQSLNLIHEIAYYVHVCLKYTNNFLILVRLRNLQEVN